MQKIPISPMDTERFAPFGDLIDFERSPDFAINNGMCDRYHGLARSEVSGEEGHTIISLGRARPYQIPLKLEMMERHPLGSQAFIPLAPISFLVVVAPDTDGRPGKPLAFLTRPGQGINYHRNVWHAVLSPLKQQADFVIVDRGGNGENLQEYFFSEPYEVVSG
ncbi:MAG: ureidoglycolate lyase [Stappiaceae bacterium]